MVMEKKGWASETFYFPLFFNVEARKREEAKLTLTHEPGSQEVTLAESRRKSEQKSGRSGLRHAIRRSWNTARGMSAPPGSCAFLEKRR